MAIFDWTSGRFVRVVLILYFLLANLVWAQTVVVDDQAHVGWYTSLALNDSGHPVISYYDLDHAALRLAVCVDASCGGETIIRTLDGAEEGDVGEFSALVLDLWGNPVISYYDYANGALKLAVCTDPTCAQGAIIRTLDGGNGVSVGQYNALALDASGNPVISYYDETHGALKLALCRDPVCGDGATIRTLDIQDDAYLGKYSSLSLNMWGKPVIGYHDATYGTLKLAVCMETDCGRGTIIRTLDGGDGVFVGQHASLAVGASDHPLISYHDATHGSLKLAVCQDPICSEVSTRTLDGEGNAMVGLDTSLALDDDGNPLISYYDPINSALKLARCKDPSCDEEVLVQTVDSGEGADVGQYSSLALDAAGNPVISYYDDTHLVLKLARPDDEPTVEPLALSPDALPDGQLAVAYEATLSASGGVGPLSIGVEGEVPGLVIENQGAILTLNGVPTSGGSFTLTVTVKDTGSDAEPLVQSYTLTIVEPTELFLNPSAGPLPQASVDSPYITSIGVSGGVAPYRFSVDADIPGLSVTVGDSDVSLSGTPTLVGDYALTVEVVDAHGNKGLGSYSLAVVSGLAIVGSLPDGVLDASYSGQFILRGGEAPIHWHLNSPLPGGLVFQDTGFLHGVPEEAGSFLINVTATDQGGEQLTADVSLLVRPTGLVLISGAPPPGLVGTYYKAPIVVSGGEPPYDCTLSRGALPLGLALDACQPGIVGNPGEAASTDITVLVVDTSQPPLSLTVDQTVEVAADTAIPQGEAPQVDSDASMVVPLAELSDDDPPLDGSEDESLQGAVVDAYGNRFLVGYAWRGDEYDAYVLGVDLDNRLFRQQRIDLGAQDYGYSVAVSPLDQSLYLNGFSFVGLEFEAFLVKLDAAGVFQWQRTNSNGPQGTVFYDSVADTSGVVVVGERFNRGNFDASITKYDHDGNLLWEFTRPSRDSESAFRVDFEPCDTPARDTACSLLVVGTTGRALSRGWVLRLDPNTGEVQDEVRLPDTGGIGLALASDGDLIIGGLNADGRWQLERLDPSLQRRWVSAYPARGLLRSVAVDREGYIYAAGRIREDGDDDGLVVIFAADGGVVDAFRYSDGQSERFSDVVIGPSGRVSAVGGQRSGDDGRFLLVDVATGKQF